MKKEFNLSEKGIYANKLVTDGSMQYVYPSKDVKEFIKKLKEEMRYFYPDNDWAINTIDNLAGKELIDNPQSKVVQDRKQKVSRVLITEDKEPSDSKVVALNEDGSDNPKRDDEWNSFYTNHASDDVCDNCDYYTEFNGEMVCSYDTIKYNDCPFPVNEKNSCKKFKQKSNGNNKTKNNN